MGKMIKEHDTEDKWCYVFDCGMQTYNCTINAMPAHCAAYVFAQTEQRIREYDAQGIGVEQAGLEGIIQDEANKMMQKMLDVPGEGPAKDGVSNLRRLRGEDPWWPFWTADDWETYRAIQASV